MRGFQRSSEVFRGFSKDLSETLSECHFPLRVAGRVAPNRVAPLNSCKKRCDSCAQGALGRRTVSQRNCCDADSLAKRYSETCH